MKILICDTLNSKVLEELQSLGECIDISASESKDKDLVSEIIDAEVVVIRSSTQLTKEIIEKGDKLKIIARCGVGVDNIDIEYAKSKNIKVTNSPSANLTSVVELAVALIINAARKINLSDSHLKDGKWDRKKFIGMELSGKQLGIVGYGKAGRLLSEVMKSFGMSIAFYDPYVKNYSFRNKFFKEKSINFASIKKNSKNAIVIIGTDHKKINYKSILKEFFKL